MSDPQRLVRWRLLLGQSAEEALGCCLGGADLQRDCALGFLYDREYGAGRNVRRGGNRQGSLDPSQLNVPDWINQVHTLFPKRTNVEFVSVVSAHELRVRFWERGVGYTRASGTGAASAAVAAILNGRAQSPVRVACDGGTLEVEWTGSGNVRQIGEVELLFEGEWLG